MTALLQPRCVVIPAIKKNAVIPDQLVKRLAGVTLIQRALTTAKHVVPHQDIWVITDSEEIRLICQRNEVQSVYDPKLRIASLDIVTELANKLRVFSHLYEHIIIYRASSPLLTSIDIEDAYRAYLQSGKDCLVTVKSIQYRLWQQTGQDLHALLFNDTAPTAYIETKALFMLHSNLLQSGTSPDAEQVSTTPYFLNDRSIEIMSYQDWWICEKLLQRKHIIFVVAGYAAIGMGHIYRALMLAHEIADHKISFLCTKESELAASSIAARDYKTFVQQENSLADAVLRLRPDLVVNDILSTDANYISALRRHNITVVNFEDEGTGAALANLVINALYEAPATPASNTKYGAACFCLRDEFLQAQQNIFRPQAKRVLVTFGGTDPSDYTHAVVRVLLPICIQHNIAIAIVAGPGYAHKETLQQYIEAQQANIPSANISFTYATNVMSGMMEQTDFAITSAGRTVYELAHMRIPAIVIAQHEREDTHTFARPENGFLYLGTMPTFQPEKVKTAIEQLCLPRVRKDLFDKLCMFDFTDNKHRIVAAITRLLASQEPA